MTAAPAALPGADEVAPVRSVAVLAGGLGLERAVSLRSGQRVATALRATGVDVVVLEPDGALLPRLLDEGVDAVFLALHGTDGEDGALRGLLEVAGVPFVGAGAAACRLAWDKPTAKQLLRGAGVATPAWVALPQRTFREHGADVVLDHLVARLGLPLAVKPATGGSALGVSHVHERAALPSAMVTCFGYADVALVERWVDGVEVAVGVVERDGRPEALPPVEVGAAADGGSYDFATRYTAGAARLHVPARVDEAVLSAARAAAVRAHRVLGLADLSRTDAVVDAHGTVQVLEVDVSPGLTETSLLPRALEATGAYLGDVLLGLLRAGAARSRTL